MRYPKSYLFYFVLCISCLFNSCKYESIEELNTDSFRGEIISAELLHAYSIEQTDSVLAAYDTTLLSYPNIYPINIYKVVYKTIDADGNETKASGSVVLPMDSNIIFPLCSYEHGTITNKESVPSRESEELLLGIIFACGGYVMSLPDYLGLGDSPGMHPYCHAKTEATASIDLLRAAKKLSADNSISINAQLFIFGYSQGGHAAMATTKEIQQNYSSEFTITASAPMSGPYDMDGAQTDVVLSDEPYAAPYYLPYLMFAYNSVYAMYDNPSDFLLEPYDELLPPLMDGTHEGYEIDAVIPDIPKQIIKPEVLEDFINNPQNPFRIALQENDLTQWKPEVPVIMYYCTADELVSFQNTINALNSFSELGSTMADKFDSFYSGSHTACAQPCFVYARTWFDSLKE